MTSFKIDKAIPIPKKQMGRVAKYPWKEMEIGDSFFVPDKTRDQVNATSPFGKYRKRQENGGVRVWRTG